jgi:uncharacterized protein DUF3489
MSSMSENSERNFMTAFAIDTDNNISVHASSPLVKESENGSETFSNPQELDKLAARWPGVRLVEIWNSLPGVEPVQRFTSRQVAATRIWKAIQHLKAAGGAQGPQGAAKRGSLRMKAARRARPAARENSKTAKVIALLRQPAGGSLKAIMVATGWQAHSVRGFISGQLGKKMGLRVCSFQRNGERVYAIKG